MFTFFKNYFRFSSFVHFFQKFVHVIIRISKFVHDFQTLFEFLKKFCSQFLQRNVGKRIQIQRDQWIPRKEGLKAANFTCRSRLRWVNQLIKPDTKEWNLHLINRIFNPFDVEEISKIRIPAREVDDCVAWHYEKNGVFTVRSAYKLAASFWWVWISNFKLFW